MSESTTSEPDVPDPQEAAPDQLASKEGSDSTGSLVPDTVDESLTQTPQFPDLEKTSKRPQQDAADLNRIREVKVKVTAELGRASVAIQELLSLEEGSVVELDRGVTTPIELFAQGVPLGNGEVVVVNEQFAIRVKQIYSNDQSN